MTERERQVLLSLFDGEWRRPMDVGGSDGSFHSIVLRRMERKGWVERSARNAGTPVRSYLYRITAEGVTAFGETETGHGEASP